MAIQKGHPKSPPIDSREALLRAAKHVFASKGFEGATVKDLADEAGVNVSLVSYHFGGKENLYRTCIENFASERVEATERMLRAPESKDDFVLRLKLFVEDFIDLTERERDTCKIVHRGMDTLDPITSDVVRKVFHRIFNALHMFLESAARSGIVKPDIDSEIVSTLMFGSLMHTIRTQEIARMLGKRTLEEAPYRVLFINHYVKSFTEGIFA